MDRRTAKHLLHVQEWLLRAAEIVALGSEKYASNPLIQEAGDSLMMKLGEAAGRLARSGVNPPDDVKWADAIANRNWLIHQYDQIDRQLTWVTLSRDLPAGAAALAPLFDEATVVLNTRSTGS